jgi:hypothetical protein
METIEISAICLGAPLNRCVYKLLRAVVWMFMFRSLYAITGYQHFPCINGKTNLKDFL